MRPSPLVRLTPGKRVFFLTRDPELIRRQLRGELDLRMEDLRVEDLMDDVNTDAMTPAWACFDYEPEKIARNAYAGITIDGERLFPEGALMEGGFEVVVSGYRKGVGSSRETAVQAEKWSGIRIAVAASFAPIHARNNIAQGVLMTDHAVLRRLQAGEAVPLAEFTAGHDAITRAIIEHGGLFPFTKAYARGEVALPRPAGAPRPMTVAEKILARHAVGLEAPVYLAPGDAVAVRVDGGYSHEFTTAQVDYFLAREYGPGYRLANPGKFAVFEDHLIYADGVARMAPFAPKIEALREAQRAFQRSTGVLDFSARGGVSPGICHTVAREQMIEPGELIQATDSHTTMGGALGALAHGVGATEYAAIAVSGLTFVEVPESIRFELVGRLPAGVTAKDVMLHILAHHARRQETLDRVMEFGGEGLRHLSPDEEAVLCNMATECSAKAGVVEVDEEALDWIVQRRPGADRERLRAQVVRPDPGARYHGGVHVIDLSALRPMVATPGDPALGVPSDPTNGALIADIGEVPIQIAYGGSCTAGKEDDLDQYAQVMTEALRAGRRVKEGVDFFIQFGSQAVEEYARGKGYVDVFEKTGVRVIHPGCGACIGCGPGVSTARDQVTVSAINRNYQNRSGPGRLYLASPLSVAASAVEGRIVAYREGMFAGKAVH
ncbi:MAG TPA: aconitase family protein [Vicinamibacteria bacterium]|jgi:3-isopropylmalate/(R)-2-methylmalate dehydratase large subunit